MTDRVPGNAHVFAWLLACMHPSNKERREALAISCMYCGPAVLSV
jgi:hypothetical protein